MSRFETDFIVQRPDGTTATVWAPSERMALKKLIRKEGITRKNDGTSTYRIKPRLDGEFSEYDVEA